MYRVNTFFRKLLLNQRVHVKHLFLMLLLGSSIAAFAGLYTKQGNNFLEFKLEEVLQGKNDEVKKTVIADQIGNLKATGITATEVKLSWEKLPAAEQYIVTIYKAGLKVKTITTSSTSILVTDLDAGTTYVWKVNAPALNSSSFASSFKTLAAEDAVEGMGPIGQVVIVGEDPIGGGGCTKKYWVRDVDQDGYFSGDVYYQCTQPAGYVEQGNKIEGDCDDADPAVKGPATWVLNQDGDNYYVGNPVVSCSSPGQFYVLKTAQLQPNDCNDASAANQTVLYVNRNAVGTNDGTSWTNAYTHLQDALVNSCGTITQIWVAKGTYYPDAGGGKTDNDRTASFVLRNNLAVYGGFAGNETMLDQRNWKTNETILSGDIDQNDLINFGNNSSNSYHVVSNGANVLDNTAIIDGFTVTAGNASLDNGIFHVGAGIYNNNASPFIRNCKLTGNHSLFGGTVFNATATTRIMNCDFNGNKAGTGGAIYNLNSDPVITECTFTNNETSSGGGAIHNFLESDAVILNCQFSNNKANSGGAILNSQFSYPTITNSVFLKNSSDTYGGAIFNFKDAKAKVINSSFFSNTATLWGASVFSGENSTIDAVNSIFWGGFFQIEKDGSSTSDVRYSIVQWNSQSVPPVFPGIGNLRDDPLFIDAGNGNLRLGSLSPAANAGNDAANNEAFDLDGNTRKIGTIDMGAYETKFDCSQSTILYVNKNASGLNNGTSWANAYTNLQDALADPCPVITQIWVAKGTYYPDEGGGKTNNDRTASFTMKNNVALYGGFDGTETSLSQRNIKNNVTILSGDIDQNDNTSIALNNLFQDPSRSGNSYSVIVNQFTEARPLTANAILNGFTITGGNANGSSPYTAGGGISNTYASPTIINCIFSGNSAYLGGGLFNRFYSSPELRNCLFSYNYTTGNGGAIYNLNYCSPEFINCTISGNLAQSPGYPPYSDGAMRSNTQCFPVLTNCIVWRNAGNIPAASDDIETLPPSITTITYSIIEAGFTGEGNKAFNPQFVNAANGDFRLQPLSPAINDGNDEANDEQFDLDGNPRRIVKIDMGAYESSVLTACPSGNILYVNKNASGLNDGRSWANAFTSLQDALASICPGITEIWVAKGTYYPDEGGGKTDNDRTASFVMKNNVTIYGGFTGNEANISQRNWRLNETILSGDIDKNDGLDFSNYDGNSIHVVLNYENGLNNTAILDGFTIRAGYAGGGAVDGENGAGIYNRNVSPVIRNCTFTQNKAVGSGAGIYQRTGSVTVSNCRFANNYAVNGAGINSFVGTVTADNSVFNNNTGSVLLNYLGTTNLTNCTFSDNTVNVIDWNAAAVHGASIDDFGSTANAVNCIFWGSGPHFSNRSTYNITYSIVKDGYPGVANSSLNPLFVDASSGNLRLQKCSPAINTGNNEASTAIVDVDGNNRIINSTIDMGAYEFTETVELIPFTATCPAALVINGCGTDAISTLSQLSYTATSVKITTQQFVGEGGTIAPGTCDIAVISYADSIDNVTSTSGKLVVIRTFTIVDVSGKSKECTQAITIEDKTAPTVLVNNITVQLSEDGVVTITPEQINNNSSDACGIDTYSLTRTDFDCSHIGANTVTLTVKDVNGNEASATATVTVVDNSKPTVNTKPVTVYLNAAGTVSITAADIDNGSTDNCGIAARIVNISSFTCANVGANTVTLTVRDVNGNEASATAEVTVVDNSKPTVNTKPVTVYLNADGTVSITAADIDNSSFDNCSIASYSLSKTEFTCSNVGANTVTLTVKDVNGNEASATATVTVVDNSKPTVNTKPITVYLNAAGTGSITAADIDNGSTDNCGIAERILNISNFTCANVGANTVTLTVKDVNGNEASATAEVTVVDNIKPTVNTKPVTVYLSAAGTASITVADVDNGSTDNCGIAARTINISNFTCANAGTNTVTLTVKDVNGNEASATATVTVLDNIKPVISSVTANPSSLWPPNHKMKPVTVTTVSTDNCGTTDCRIISVTSNEPTSETGDGDLSTDWEITGKNTVNLRAERAGSGNGRIYTITVECKDASGNATQSTTNVIVAHNITAPVSGASYKIGSTVSFAGTFWDVPGTKHTARWVIDNSTVAGKVTAEPGGLKNGTVTGSYKFSTAGVYKLRMEIIDQYGNISYANTNGDMDAIIVVYDPNGGYAFGGGKFYSEAGAQTANPAAKGMVSYG
ncbi:MAG: hypothetical protein GXC73_05520, partial [Chitinophagaceae bacterium]|nr:hypothetical protein [Chitinophagaceae bacterium]